MSECETEHAQDMSPLELLSLAFRTIPKTEEYRECHVATRKAWNLLSRIERIKREESYRG